MTADDGFCAHAAERYVQDNRESLHWLLSRLPATVADASEPSPAFIDTKVDPLTLRDYTEAHERRGPSYTYDWIQGRGLEALCTHAAFFESRDPALSAALDSAAHRVGAALEHLVSPSGESAFCRDEHGVPVTSAGADAGRPQRRDAHLRCYGDIFVAKGLLAAASRRGDTAAVHRQLDVLADIVDAVDDARFVLDERGDLDQAVLAAQPDDYGPRMILLGASALLRRLDLPQHDDFSERFLRHVLEVHRDPRSGLLADTPGGTSCNVGHGIECVGLAFDTLRGRLSGELETTLCEVLLAHARAGFASPGLALSVDVPTGKPSSPYRPWWSLPETVRAAALAFEATARPDMLSIWKCADADYFTHYRRAELPIAYQTLTADGPIDHVPATPDLDPAYHTGLSLLTAVESVHRSTDRAVPRPTAR